MTARWLVAAAGFALGVGGFLVGVGVMVELDDEPGGKPRVVVVQPDAVWCVQDGDGEIVDCSWLSADHIHPAADEAKAKRP